jgi:hypothetical protein
MKRSYGLPIDYYQLVEHTLDPESGNKTTVLTKTHIKNAIVLRAREFRSFVYDLAFISANKDFTTGGFFDPEDRRVIIDRKDMPFGFNPNVDDYIIFQNNKYEVIELFEFEENATDMLLVRKIRGTPIVRIEEALSVLDLQQNQNSAIQDKLDRTVKTLLTLTQEVKEVP